MAKGLFTQGMCVLLRQSVGADVVRSALSEFEYEGVHESAADGDGAQTLVFRFREEVQGHLLVTISQQPWPDDLGDPDSTPERFIAWSLGQYGPYSFPGCLKRAGQQSWGWDEGEEVVTEHCGHLRCLISYVFGSENFGTADEEEGSLEQLDERLDDLGNDLGLGIVEPDGHEVPVLPADYEPLGEMTFLTRAVEAILQLPQASCYFNPAGEVIRDRDGLRRGLNHAWSHDLPPLEMWTNVRLFQADSDWSLMDTVGNSQFDVPDVEAVFQTGKYEPIDVQGFLRSAALYMLQSDEDIEDGDTADGPGDLTWRAIRCEDGLSDPPRETVRWVPQDETDPPEALLDPGEDEDLDDEDFGDDADDDEFQTDLI